MTERERERERETPTHTHARAHSSRPGIRVMIRSLSPRGQAGRQAGIRESSTTAVAVATAMAARSRLVKNKQDDGEDDKEISHQRGGWPADRVSPNSFAPAPPRPALPDSEPRHFSAGIKANGKRLLRYLFLAVTITDHRRTAAHLPYPIPLLQFAWCPCVAAFIGCLRSLPNELIIVP